MRNSSEKTGPDMAVLTGILILIAIAHTVTAQIDTTNKKQFIKDPVKPVKLLQSKYSLPPFSISGKLLSMNPPAANRLMAPYPYNESNASKTILKILGMGALPIFGDRTNHQYNAYKPY